MIMAAVGIYRIYLVPYAQKQNILLADMTEEFPSVESSDWNALCEVRAAWGLVFNHECLLRD
jgi:hypothetical protein